MTIAVIAVAFGKSSTQEKTLFALMGAIICGGAALYILVREHDRLTDRLTSRDVEINRKLDDLRSSIGNVERRAEEIRDEQRRRDL